MRSFRSHRASLAPGVAASSLVTALALLVACQDDGPRAPARASAEVAAVAWIDGAPIREDELRAAFARVRQAYRSTPAHAHPPWDLLKRTTLDRLVEERLLLREAERRNIIVTPEEVEAALRLMRQGYDDERFAEAILAEGLSPSRLRQEIRSRLAVERLVADEGKAAAAPRNDESRQFYLSSPARFAAAERIRARQILVRTEEEAKRLRKKALAGADFAALARHHSIAHDAISGGDLGTFRRTERPSVVEQACFALAPGKISPVVPSDLGFHIFLVVERHAARTRSFEESRAEVERALAGERVRRAEASLRARLLATARIEVDEARLRRIQ